TRLRACARERYAKASAAGNLSARIASLVEEKALPRLPEDLYWTRTLLADLLTLDGRFALIGNARDAYVPIPNQRGIETLSDLLAALLARDYSGACSLEQLQEDLRQAGVIRKRLTPTMLGDGHKVCIRGSTVLLSELVNDA
ncbi:MAG: hypothetical protein JXA57_07045, partial [Armatimonadetes bacterium]|nr:hypothetical protein [Armatimonadota bacterium]